MDAFTSDRRSLRAQVDFDRRQMLTVSLAAGFAAAVRPVAAATAITTDSTGLVAGEVRIPRAAVAWYGKLVGEQNAMTPRHPVDIAKDLKAPVLGLYGEADPGIPVSTVEQMRAACTAADKSCAIVVYPGAPHAFHADYRPSYRADIAKPGWGRMLDWFRAHGVT